MAEDRHGALVAIALEIHNLLKRPGVRDRYVKTIWDWIEARQIADQQRDERNQPTLSHLARMKAGKTDDLPERPLETADFDGPAPLYERPPWSICQCYVATAVIHDALLVDLRGRTIDAVEPICPAGREHRRFHLLTVRDEGGRFFNEAELFEGPLRDALERVRNDLGGPRLADARAAERTGTGRKSSSDVVSFDDVANLLGHTNKKRVQNEVAKWRKAGHVIHDPCSYAVIRPLVLETWPDKETMFPPTLNEAKRILNNLR